MPTINSSTFIKKTQEEVYNLSQDYSLRLEWDPFLKEIDLLNDAKFSKKGVQVRVKSKDNLSMTVEYIFVNSPKSVAMNMISGPFYFEKFAGSWKFEQFSENLTRASFRYNFKIKNYCLPFILNYFVNKSLQKNMDKRLNSLKNAAEKTDILDRLTIDDSFIEFEE